jgi:hypothetical protein
MNKYQIIDRIGDAMNLLADGQQGDTMLALYKLQRELRYDFGQITTPNEAKASVDTAWKEAKASVALDGETYSLPPMKPIRGGKLKSLDVSCPTCLQRAGQQCLKMTRKGPGADPVPGSIATHIHHTRVAKAKAAN